MGSLKITTQEIKTRLPISEVLRYYNGQCVNRNSGSWWCIMHEAGGKASGHKTPSLVARDDKGTATCMSKGCFSGDDIFGVIAIMEVLNLKTDFHKIKKKACDIAGILYEQRPSRRRSIRPLGTIHFDYLESYEISRETMRRFGLKARYCYVLYPQTQDREVKGYKGISIYKSGEKRKQFFEGKPAALFYSMEQNQKKHLILTEGEKDCLRLAEQIMREKKSAQFFSASTTMGARTIHKNIIEVIKSLEPTDISIIYDNDEAGYKGSIKLANHLVKVFDKITVYSLPKERKKGYDLTDFLNEGKSLNELFCLTKQVFKKKYQSASSLYPSYSLSQDSLFDTMIPEKILKTGYTTVDEICPMVRGENTIITGRTGKGKTMLSVNFVNGILKNTPNSKVMIFSLELKKKAFLQRLLTAEYDIEAWKLKRGFIGNNNTIFQKQKEDYIKSSNEYLNSFKDRLMIIDNIHKVEKIEQLLNTLKNKINFTPDYILIDYANILSYGKLVDTTKHIEISTWMKFLAKEHNIHVQAICQANRATRENEDSYARTENLADSDQYARDAFIVYSIKTSMSCDTYYINPIKNRNGKPEEEIKLFWKPKSGKIIQKNESNTTLEIPI